MTNRPEDQGRDCNALMPSRYMMDLRVKLLALLDQYDPNHSTYTLDLICDLFDAHR